MATGNIILMPNAALLPDGTASNLAPAMQKAKSTGTAPGIYFFQLAFDAATDEWVTWSFRMPDDYNNAVTPTFKIQYKMASAVTLNVVWDVRVGSVSGGSATNIDTKVFAAANTATATVPTTTAGKINEVSVTLTNNDSLLAGDFTVIRVSRVGSSGSDTAAGDAELVACSLSYTTL